MYLLDYSAIPLLPGLTYNVFWASECGPRITDRTRQTRNVIIKPGPICPLCDLVTPSRATKTAVSQQWAERRDTETNDRARYLSNRPENCRRRRPADVLALKGGPKGGKSEGRDDTGTGANISNRSLPKLVGAHGTYKKPRQKTTIRASLCTGGKGSVFSSGRGMMRIRTSVMTCMTPCPIQNQSRLSHVHVGSRGSQFLSRGRQTVAPPTMPATVHTARKARKTSQRRWKAGRGKTRRNWRRNVDFRSIMVMW